jgi:small GTP-binding protein
MAHISELISTDIESYLKSHEEKSLLRFITCGSVDDGKSTLIGRMLYESQMLFDDQLSALKSDSKKIGTQGDEIDFALLVDGLAAEREQGITIDVAYRFFSTDKRKYIVADTPGHEEYTRNMATGASTADVAIILIDAKQGVLTQTRRHSFIVSMVGVKKVLLAVNKLDLVDYSEEVYRQIVSDYSDFAESALNIDSITAMVSPLETSISSFNVIVTDCPTDACCNSPSQVTILAIDDSLPPGCNRTLSPIFVSPLAIKPENPLKFEFGRFTHCTGILKEVCFL